MGPISLTTSIDAPREQVFDFICDLAVRPAWIDHFAEDYRVERIPAQGQGAAARFRVDAPGGIRYMETVIAEVDRPYRIVENGRGGRLDHIPIRAVWELREGPTTEVTLTFWTHPPTTFDRLREFGRGGWWHRRWAKALRRMRELIESGEGSIPRGEVAGGNPQPTGVP